jgi:hypothetical protein
LAYDLRLNVSLQEDVMPKPPIKRRTPAIISASRLTDIPRYFATWFTNRRRAGYCISANSFGSHFLISLKPDDVLGYLFWTRDARPLLAEIKSLLGESVPVAAQFTITGYGPEFENRRVPFEEQIQSFCAVSQLLPAPSCIQLRYDPVVVGGQYNEDWHEKTLDRICQSLRGHTLVVNTSICEPYVTVVSRIERMLPVRYRVADPERHPSTVKRFPYLNTLDPLPLLRRLANVVRGHQMQLRICANPECAGADGLPTAQCCGLELFAPYPIERTRRLRSVQDSPSRTGCRCIATSDIGMSDTCPAGCLYCYVTGALQKSQNFFARHNPDGESIR